MATEDFGRDPDRQVPVTTGERAGELAEAATLLCVGLMVGRRLERLGQLVDQRFGARPLADQLPGLAGDAVNRPLTHPAARVLSHLTDKQRVQRGEGPDTERSEIVV